MNSSSTGCCAAVAPGILYGVPRVMLACAVALAVLAALASTSGHDAPARSDSPVLLAVPWPAGEPQQPTRAAVREAKRWTARRAGRVSFAVADDARRRFCFACRQAYRSASLSKAMLLVADLRRLATAGRSPGAAERRQLSAMVRSSDNEAADVVFARVGDAGLLSVAKLADMRDFRPAGHWSQAWLTAADQARFFARLSGLLPDRDEPFARGLLRSVVAPQAWGIPAASRPAWRTLFKGGWRPELDARLVHQAARLERQGRVVAVAVLTDGQPDHGYGAATIRGIAERLLRAPARRG